MKHNNPGLVSSLVEKLDAVKFDKDVFDKTGLFIVRNAIPGALVKEWRAEWDSFYEKNLAAGRNVNLSNPVDLKEPLPETLAKVYRNKALLDFAEQVFGANVALYNHRFVIKDKFSPGEIFLHHDFCYHLGMPNKASFFVPLSYAGKSNGGLTFYLGTHKYGYLGDAGEINPDNFGETWPQVTPEVNPGDFIIMNSLLWHKSGVNEAGIDRIVADIIYQPASDPSSKELLRGEWQTDIFITNDERLKYFKSSRVTKMIEMGEKLKKVSEQEIK